MLNGIYEMTREILGTVLTVFKIEPTTGIIYLGRWVAKLVAHLLAYGSSLGSNPDISQKYKMGNISREVANTL